MKHLLGAFSGVQVIQTVGSTSLFICLCLAAVSCSKGNCVTSTDFRRASLTVDGKEIRFEYRTISPPISVGAPLEQQGTESAHRAWLRVYHYEASGEYESIVDLAVDTDQAKNYVAYLENQPRANNEKTLKTAMLQHIVGEIRVGDRYMVLMTKPARDGSRKFTGQCAVKTPEGFRIVAVPYYQLADLQPLFDVLEALRAGKWELGRGT